LQEAQLDCQIAAAKADNEKLTKMVESTRAAVAQTDKRLADLETAYAAKRYSRDQAQKELASVDESTASIQHSVDAMKKRLGEYQQARENTQQAANNSLNTAELDKQIADLKMQIASAETDLDKLVTHRKVAQVG
jgi:chromosome segregation ATPase